MSLDAATAKVCQGPCMYWCSEKKHNAVRVCVALLLLVAGVCIGLLIARGGGGRHQSKATVKLIKKKKGKGKKMKRKSKGKKKGFFSKAFNKK